MAEKTGSGVASGFPGSIEWAFKRGAELADRIVGSCSHVSRVLTETGLADPLRDRVGGHDWACAPCIRDAVAAMLREGSAPDAPKEPGHEV